MFDQTRRNWMVTISHAAVGLRLSGSMAAVNEDRRQLPPGVYEASRDQLGHALMSADTYHSVVPGCPTDYIRPTSQPFKPTFFSDPEFVFISRLTELLLGDPSDNRQDIQEVAEWMDLRVSSASGTRSASMGLNTLQRRLHEGYYGVAQVKTRESDDPASTCREGLAWLENAAKAQHSMNFMALGIPQQLDILDSVSDERADKQTQNAGTKLFDFLKTETIRGFYTSRAGLKELDFKGNAYYARSPACSSK